MNAVKAKRRYNSAGRKEQARRSREAILDAAQRLFLEAGYAVTTIAAIAEEAGVSVETVYKAFGGKPGLVRAIYEGGLLGRGTISAYRRSDEMREQESDPRVIMRKWGELTAEVASTITPILLLIRAAAAADPDMAQLLNDTRDQRLERMRHNARGVADRGFLREDVTLDEATDVMWTCSSPELYELLVLQRGWSLTQFAPFVADMMIGTLLPKSD
jgi:AcrR family transcriptional regulator